MNIDDGPTGAVSRTWIGGDLPSAGLYIGMIKLTYVGDGTYPRSFPNDGTKLTWYVYDTI
jgi:hypothetical protein